jgi:hypothetical protein
VCGVHAGWGECLSEYKILMRMQQDGRCCTTQQTRFGTLLRALAFWQRWVTNELLHVWRNPTLHTTTLQACIPTFMCLAPCVTAFTRSHWQSLCLPECSRTLPRTASTELLTVSVHGLCIRQHRLFGMRAAKQASLGVEQTSCCCATSCAQQS